MLKTKFLFLVCKKRQKEDKKIFVTKSVGIILTIFTCKNISQTVSKTFATQCLLTHTRENSKMLNITSKSFSFFDNKLPGS